MLPVDHIVHRNATMVREVDLLTRYNRFANQFRQEGEQTKSDREKTLMALTLYHAPPIGTTNIPLSFVGPPLAPRTEAASR